MENFNEINQRAKDIKGRIVFDNLDIKGRIVFDNLSAHEAFELMYSNPNYRVARWDPSLRARTWFRGIGGLVNGVYTNNYELYHTYYKYSFKTKRTYQYRPDVSTEKDMSINLLFNSELDCDYIVFEPYDVHKV